MRRFSRELSPGFRGVRETVRTIAALAWIGSDRPRLKRLASSINRRSATTTIRDLDRMARTKIRYELDPLGIEEVSGIDALLARKRGDCDDYTVFLSALGLALDIPTRITVVRRRDRKNFHHVFPEFLLDKRWIPIDSTVESPPGTFPARIASRVSFPIPSPRRQ